MTLTTKLASAMVFLAIATAGVVGMLIYRNLEQAILPAELARLEGHAQRQSARLDEVFSLAHKDAIAFATGAAALEGIVRAMTHGGVDPQDGTTAQAWKARMARRFAADLEAKPGYAQFRLIGVAEGGRELVRVDRSGPSGAVRIVPDEELQAKGEREYFARTVKLPAGAIYFSKIELNREHGEIELPHQPVVRVATPIYTPAGEVFGVLVINFDLRRTFALVAEPEHPGGRVYVVNEGGYYLAHREKERTFGLELGREDRLQTDYPELAERVGKDEAKIGLIRTPAGDALGVAMLPLRPSGGPWLALVEVVPEAELLAPLALVRHSSLVAGVSVALLAVVLAMVLARSMTGPLVMLTRTMESFSIGQVSPIKVTATGEIGVLARAFVAMQNAVNAKTMALHLSEKRYRALFEYAPDGIVIADVTSRYLDANASICRMLGYTRDELIGKHASDIVSPAEIEHIAPALAVIKSQSDYNREWLFRRKDGSIFPAEVKATMMPDGNLLAVIRDITERKRAEEMIRESEEHFRFLDSLVGATRALIDAEQIMAVVVRILGEHLGVSRCAYADVEKDSERFTILHDYTDGCETTVGKYHLSLFGAQTVTTLTRGEILIIRNVDTEISSEEGADMFNAIGIKAIITCPLVKEGRLRAMMAVHQTTPRNWSPAEITLVQDVVERCWAIIERRKTEEEIQRLNIELEQRVVERTSQLEAANKELEAFSYSVSHDLRAPLRAIDGFSQAVLEDFGAKLPAEGLRYLLTIRSGAQRMGELIDDLLTFARLSRQALDQRMVDMSRLANKVVEEMASAIEGRQVSIKIGELLPCHGDAALLKQVWVNLISNALKYSRKREQAEIEIDCVQEKGWNTYLIRDNGTGFDMQYAHKLFGVFQRLHLAEDYEGTGVGLAIVQRVIHRHGGRVWAEATVDRGATFYFTLKGEPKHE